MSPTEKVFGGMFLALCFVVGFLLPTPFKQATPAPVAQPSVPSLIPPPLSCLCGATRQAVRPFSVTCPYCRNTLSVQPSATGSVAGDVVGAVAKPAK